MMEFQSCVVGLVSALGTGAPKERDQLKLPGSPALLLFLVRQVPVIRIDVPALARAKSATAGSEHQRPARRTDLSIRRSPLHVLILAGLRARQMSLLRSPRVGL
jgi:hypothetical protein